jgi:primosomal protein N' (replication factor Y)
MECGADFHADTSHFVLTGEQDSALSRIKKNLDEKKHEVFLLHGVTGSGKTEIYLRVIQHALGQGKTSIILVPEISLTPQTVGTFSSRFGDTVAVIHSGLTGAMKFSEWDRIKKGSARIIVGARSAVFSPLKDLGAVIIDEEHETSYKQEDVPRYHARDVAIKRAEMSGQSLFLEAPLRHARAITGRTKGIIRF